MLKKNKTFFRIFISYVIILIIPMSILGSINYYQSSNIVRNNIENDIAAELKQASLMLDSRSKEINTICKDIALDTSVQSMLYSQSTDVSDNVMLAINVKNGILDRTLLNDFVDSVYIYSKKDNTIVSANSLYSPETFFSAKYGEIKNESAYEKRYNEWLKLIQQPNAMNFQSNVSLFGTKASDEVYYIDSIPYTNENFGCTMVSINKNKYISVLSDVIKKSNTYYYILNYNSDIVVSNDTTGENNNIIKKKLKESSSISTIKTPGGKALYISTESSYNKWKYIAIVPYSSFISEINGVKMTTIVVIIICLIIGFLISLLAASNNYKNISGIVDFIKETYGSSQEEIDDFKLIKNIIQSSYSEISLNRKMLKEQMPLIKRSYLENVLVESGEVQIDENALTTELFEINLNFANSTVIIFRIKEILAIINKETDLQILKFALRKVVEEKSAKQYLGYALEIDNNNIAFICGTNETSTEEFENSILLFAEDVRSYLESKVHIRATIGIGNIYQGYKKISFSYEEAVQAVDCAIFNNESIVQFKNVSKSCKLFSFPIQKEVQLINYIKSGKKKQAIDILDDLYEENCKNKDLTYDMLKFFVYDLYCTIIKILGDIKAINNQHVLTTIQNMNEHNRNLKDIDFIIKDIKSMITEICAFLEEQKKKNSMDLKNSIVEYVEKNYSDNQLSLDVMAEKFNVTPQYLSRFFKEHVGINYVDYVNELKINKAKEYLINGEKVKDAAVKAGFENIGTFINVFKKAVGQTPGEYKEKMER